MTSEFTIVSKHLHRIQLKNNDHRIVVFQFRDSDSAFDIDMAIRNIFGIEQNQTYAVSYPDKCTGENIYIVVNGQRLSDYVMIGIEVFDVIVHPSASRLPAGKLYITFIFLRNFR